MAEVVITPAPLTSEAAMGSCPADASPAIRRNAFQQSADGRGFLQGSGHISFRHFVIKLYM